MGRSVGTMIETELALVAQIGDIPQIRSREFLRIAVYLRSIKPSKQIAEGRTKTKSTATPVTYI